MSKVPDGDLPLLVDVGDEWAAVVDTEVEDTVLIRCLESGTEDGGIFGLRNWRQIEAVERREHAELKLNVVVWSRDKGLKVVHIVFGDLNLEMLLSS